MEASPLKPVDSARLNMDDMPPETIRARDIEGRMSRRDAGESFLKKHLMLLERSGFLWNDFTNFQGVPGIKSPKKRKILCIFFFYFYIYFLYIDIY